MLARAPFTFAVFASGAGSNFEALTRASREPGFPGAIAWLISDAADAGALERARRLEVASLVLPCGRFRTRIEDESTWVQALRDRGVDAVLLAGFMRRLHAPLLEAFRDRILNVHPSLLPAFPGRDAIEQAWRHGVRVTGVTVHVVADQVDAGPIVAQAPVEIEEGESLERLTERVHTVEHRLYPEAVRRYFGAEHLIDGGRVTLDTGSIPSPPKSSPRPLEVRRV